VLLLHLRSRMALRHTENAFQSLQDSTSSTQCYGSPYGTIASAAGMLLQASLGMQTMTSCSGESPAHIEWIHMPTSITGIKTLLDQQLPGGRLQFGGSITRGPHTHLCCLNTRFCTRRMCSWYSRCHCVRLRNSGLLPSAE
jgi:hypothetical protein